MVPDAFRMSLPHERQGMSGRLKVDDDDDDEPSMVTCMPPDAASELPNDKLPVTPKNPEEMFKVEDIVPVS